MTVDQTGRVPTGFWAALALNFVWINASEVVRYFFVIRPMLNTLFPTQPEIGAMNAGIFAIWAIWDTILIVAATGFFWLWLERFGSGARQVLTAATMFTMTIFGLIWIGVANMGFAPFTLLFAALPLAWIEQVIACALVAWMMRKYQPSSSIRSI